MAATPPAQLATRGLSRYAALVVLATFGLLFFGAMVTTKDAGLAVPDWPLSFGSLNPPGWWKVEPVFWEHSHRLAGATIGLLVIGLVAWAWRAENRRWVRRLAWLALAAVILQGVMGGLRVTQISTALALVHGCFAQLFLALLVVLATVTSVNWRSCARLAGPGELALLRGMAIGFCVAVLVQLVLGAGVRHGKATMAIPDFPLAFGHLIPPYWNHAIGIHFVHRAWALVVLVAALVLLGWVRCRFRGEPQLSRAATALPVLWLLQVLLGASVIWTGRSHLLTTGHVLLGAFILAAGVHVAAWSFALKPHGMLLAKAGAPDAAEKGVAT